MLYLKFLMQGEERSLFPAAQAHYGEYPYLTWIEPHDVGGGSRSHYRGDFIACYVMSESGKTLDKIRGFTPDECERWPRIDDNPEVKRQAAAALAAGLAVPVPAATIPKEDQITKG